MKIDSNKFENKNKLKTSDIENAPFKTAGADKNKTETKASASDKELDDKNHDHQYTTPNAKSTSKDLKIHGKGWDETPTDKKNDKK